MATKKPSAAQLAARKLFAERSRAGALKSGGKRKTNPLEKSGFKIGDRVKRDGRVWAVVRYSHDGTEVEIHTVDKKSPLLKMTIDPNKTNPAKPAGTYRAVFQTRDGIGGKRKTNPTVSVEYLNGIKEGRSIFKEHGAVDIDERVSNLTSTIKKFSASSPTGQFLRGELDFWKNQKAVKRKTNPAKPAGTYRALFQTRNGEWSPTVSGVTLAKAKKNADENFNKGIQVIVLSAKGDVVYDPTLNARIEPKLRKNPIHKSGVTYATSKLPANFPHCVQVKNTENWNTKACFIDKGLAVEYAQAIADAHPKLPVRVVSYTGGAI